MARVLITGSADGLGQMAARLLADCGHQVVLHARDPGRAKAADAGVPGADGVLIGDLASIEETRKVAEQANAYGRFDAVIHNAGVGYREPERVLTKDGLAHVFAVNVLAPYLLTALIDRPGRLVYLSSGMHRRGNPDLGDLQWDRRRWNGLQAYADSKLFDVILAFAVARRWPGVLSNALEPGWVATRTGGPRAPGRPHPGPPHPGLVGRQRPSGRHNHGRLLLPSAAPGRSPRRSRPDAAGRAPHRLRGADRHAAARQGARLAAGSAAGSATDSGAGVVAHPMEVSGRGQAPAEPVARSTTSRRSRRSIAAAISSGNTSGVQAKAGTPRAASAAAFSWS